MDYYHKCYLRDPADVLRMNYGLIATPGAYQAIEPTGVFYGPGVVVVSE